MSESCIVTVGNRKINTENAIVLPLLEHVDVTHYVKAVAGVVGSRHILGAYKQCDSIKIYLDDPKYVSNIINAGVSVLGHHTNVDYAVPPGIKVCLSNLDPGIPDSAIENLLQAYGSVESCIFHEKISTDLEYSHIENGVRFTYMKFNENSIPSAIKCVFDRYSYEFNVRIVNSEQIVPHKDGYSKSREVIYSRKSLTDRNNINSNTDRKLEGGVIANGSIQDSSAASTSLTYNTNQHASSHFRSNFMNKQSFRGRRMGFYNYGRKKRGGSWRNNFSRISKIKKKGRGASNLRSRNRNFDDESNDQYVQSDEDRSCTYPLSDDKFYKFLNECKHKRHDQILEAAKKYLRDGDFKDQLKHLKEQLEDYGGETKDPSLKARINRVLTYFRSCLKRN